VDPRILQKIKQHPNKPIRTWSRACVITPEMVGIKFEVHNGKNFILVSVKEEMVGHKLGEFAPTRIFRGHGGRMAREQEQKKQAQEAAKTTAAQKT
jgi:small subunit ribosomal protein S19